MLPLLSDFCGLAFAPLEQARGRRCHRPAPETGKRRVERPLVKHARPRCVPVPHRAPFVFFSLCPSNFPPFVFAYSFRDVSFMFDFACGEKSAKPSRRRKPDLLSSTDEALSVMDEKVREWKVWVSGNKLQSVGTLWAFLMAANLAFQFTRPVPLQLKLIHSRVYSQFVTVGGTNIVLFSLWSSFNHLTDCLLSTSLSRRRHRARGGARPEHQGEEGRGVLRRPSISLGMGLKGAPPSVLYHFFPHSL